jgi:hypothetical protein
VPSTWGDAVHLDEKGITNLSKSVRRWKSTFPMIL